MPQTLPGYNQQGQWPSSSYAARTSLVSSGSAGGRGGSLSAPPGCAEATTDFRLSDLEKKKKKGRNQGATGLSHEFSKHRAAEDRLDAFRRGDELCRNLTRNCLTSLRVHLIDEVTQV